MRIAILLASALLFARADLDLSDPAFINVSAQASTCATTDTSIAHDELLEGWEGDGTELLWGEVGSGGTITAGADTSALSSGKVTGQCDKALRCQINASQQYYTNLFSSAISFGTTTDLIFYLYVSSQPADGQNFNMFEWVGGAASLIIEGFMGSCYLTVDGSVDSTPTTITTGTWHKIQIHMDATAGNSYLKIDSGSNLGFTRFSANYEGVRFGGIQGTSAGESADFYVDLVCINTP